MFLNAFVSNVSDFGVTRFSYSTYTILCVFSGLGYITGAGCAALTGDWHWALRVRTFSLSVTLILIALTDV